MRDLSVLSDIELEMLVGDLFAAELNTHVERFARGADDGIDLRWKLTSGGVAIGQCKHYLRSTFQQLLAAAKAEVKHLATTKPEHYRFVTSQDLTKGQKDKLVGAMKPWLHGPEDVYGGRDVDGLLTRFPAVEQAHPKLWISSGSQLFWATHSDLAARAKALRDDVLESIPRYVINDSFARGKAMLRDSRVCLIAGHPGIGKTTLAYALVANAIADGYQPIEISDNIDEGWTADLPGVPQVFLYDDFLGKLTLTERMGKNEDVRLLRFIRHVVEADSKLLVMTTREYILQDAQRVHPLLANIDDHKRLILELNDYSRGDRARILYNHLWHAELSSEALVEIAQGGYLPIISHRNYSPRLIEYCTGPGFDLRSAGYPERFVYNLDHPEQIWREAFEEHLDLDQQLVAVVLTTLPDDVETEFLEQAHSALCQKRHVGVTAARFRSALKVMDDTFLGIDRSAAGASEVRFHNPSVHAYVLDWLGQDETLVADLVSSSIYFEQVRNLYRYAAGHRSRRAGEPSSDALSDAVSMLTADIAERLRELIASPTPEHGNDWVDDPAEPIASWFEDRLLFILDLPATLSPPTAWFDQQLTALTERWSKGEGHKRRALELFERIERDIEVDRAVHDAAAFALGAWLSRELNETDIDWEPYIRWLDRDGIPLDHLREVAHTFESHAREELGRWSPSPPELPELLEYARRFDLPDLVERLEEEERESAERARLSAEKRKQEKPPAESKPARATTDAELAQLFGRLRR